jgi:polysaccharide biosynthesis/export protein
VFSAKSLKLREFLGWLAVGFSVFAATVPLSPAVAADTPPPPVVAADASPSPPVSANYLIGPGDSLHIYVFQNEELSVTVPVRPDGKISTPLVEDMVAVGKTPSQLARDIEQSLAVYV